MQTRHSLLTTVLFTVADKSAPRYHCMEARCPHLGAPLDRGIVRTAFDDIEDLIVVWCVVPTLSDTARAYTADTLV